MLIKTEYEKLFYALKAWKQGVIAFEKNTGINVESGFNSNLYTEAWDLLCANNHINKDNDNWLFEIVYQIITQDYYYEIWEDGTSFYLTFDNLYDAYCVFIESNGGFPDDFVKKYSKK